jgi:hypothetical protein
MPKHVCNGALLKCSMGLAPSTFVVPPINRELTSNQPAANIMDHIPMLNVMPFGMCQSPSNPVVIAATAAALGTPTPAPCIPATPAPWVPGSPTVLLANMPALNDTSKLNCIWAGIIEVTMPGQMTHDIA